MLGEHSGSPAGCFGHSPPRGIIEPCATVPLPPRYWTFHSPSIWRELVLEEKSFVRTSSIVVRLLSSVFPSLCLSYLYLRLVSSIVVIFLTCLLLFHEMAITFSAKILWVPFKNDRAKFYCIINYSFGCLSFFFYFSLCSFLLISPNFCPLVGPSAQPSVRQNQGNVE